MPAVHAQLFLANLQPITHASELALYLMMLAFVLYLVTTHTIFVIDNTTIPVQIVSCVIST